MPRKPNLVFVFADQWRAQATGYSGDPNCGTPTLDALAGESVHFTRAVSGCPVCSPYRASLMTGQYPLTHGVYLNDVELNPQVQSLPRALRQAGYRTAYVGKWHLCGSPDGAYGRRGAYVPREHQLGFDDWKGFECTHDYQDSWHYHNDDPAPRRWEGYDAFAQSRAAAEYIRAQAGREEPYLMMLSWGPPHEPLHTAPEEHRQRYAAREISLRPNVPEAHREAAEADLRGYYAHIAALDDCLKIVLEAIRDSGAEEDTLLVFTSDHGDMLHSQGLRWKQLPFEESVRVPFLLRYPRLPGREKQECRAPIDAPDLMPTLLGLAGVPVPETVEGRDWSPFLRGEAHLTGEEAALLSMPVPFSFLRAAGFEAYRGLRTDRYTYVRALSGPLFLFDNREDPYQQRNLAHRPKCRDLQDELEARLQARLDALGDRFEPAEAYLKRDGLAHYREATCPVGEPWLSPWQGGDRS